MATLSEQLESVQAAIADVESNGQHIAVNGRVYTKADLATLYQRENHLQGKSVQKTQSIFDRALTARPLRR